MPEPDIIRISQLETTIDKIEKGSKRKTEPAPVAPQQQADRAALASRQIPGTRARTAARRLPTKTVSSVRYLREIIVDARADWRAEQATSRSTGRNKAQNEELSALKGQAGRIAQPL